MADTKETSVSRVSEPPVYVDKAAKEVDGVLGCLTPKQQEALDAIKADPVRRIFYRV